MTIDYEVEYVREHIESDIDNIRREYHKDVSPEIGRMLSSFISCREHRGSNVFFSKFSGVLFGLQRYLSERMNNSIIYLHETLKGGAFLCKALEENDEMRLKKFRDYFKELANKDLVLNGMDQIFP